jgi:hypothetical protein
MPLIETKQEMEMPKGVYERKPRIKKDDFATPRMSMVVTETDDQIDTRLRSRFRTVGIMAKSACDGITRSLIVSGPPGLGKSFTVEKIVSDYDKSGKKAVICKGYVRPTGLYKTLYEYRHAGNVIVFDDCDSAFQDMDALNLLKAACDTTEKRRLMWGAETRMTDANGKPMPWSFDFEGSIIFITNYDFDAAIAANNKFSEHFNALISRSHYIDTGMKSIRDYLVRIQQVVDEGMLDDMGLTAYQQRDIIDFVFDNAPKFRELTLRMVIKLAGLYNISRTEWKTMASVTLFKKV